MRGMFYLRMARNNLKKNRRLFVPYILAGAGLTAVFYIMMTLNQDERLTQVRGGSYLPMFMSMGAVIVGIMSVILIFYTNSFLMKQRTRELGLYNVLGLEKRHVGRICFWESALSGIGSIVLGLILGVLFYTLFAQLICRIMGVKSDLGVLHLDMGTVVMVSLCFGALYLATILVNRIRIQRMKPVELLQSSHVGEKEPKIHWIYLIVGLLSLGTGYFMSVTIQSPLAAINKFFVAVLLVILGTYCLFMTGITAVLKLMKKNRNVYYHPRRMISISGMMYRMKQNAVGLASITILSTMVLVMVSVTGCMYAGIDETIRSQFPHDMYVNVMLVDPEVNADGREPDSGDYEYMPKEDLLRIMDETAKEFGLEYTFAGEERYLDFSFLLDGDTLRLDREQIYSVSNVVSTMMITREQYEALTGETLELTGDQVALWSMGSNETSIPDDFHFESEEREFHVAQRLEEYPISNTTTIVDMYGIVVADDATYQYINDLQREYYQENASREDCEFVFDFADDKAVQEVYEEFDDTWHEKVGAYAIAYNGGASQISFSNRYDAYNEIYSMYGSLLFLGLLLTFVFLFATALIIYYKQLSEGYDDRDRFQILQKVGMSGEEVKATIRNQILLVFFLPPVVAMIHTIFAFPMLTKMLRIFFICDEVLFFGCAGVVFLVFLIVYIAIYGLTAKTYYRIVR